MSQRTFARLNGLSGLFGIVILITSFIINPAPPQAHPTGPQLLAFGQAHYTQILAGAWMQAVGTVLCIVFAVSIVHLNRATSRFSGWMTLYGGTLLATTSLVEVGFYLSATTGVYPDIALISLDLIHALQRLYFIVTATAIFFPLGIVILNGRALPKAFGYAALLVAVTFTTLGILGFFFQLQTVDDTAGSLQGVWWLAASIALLVGAGRFPTTALGAPEKDAVSA